MLEADLGKRGLCWRTAWPLPTRNNCASARADCACRTLAPLPPPQNIHALDPQSIPTAAALKNARVVVDRLLERQKEEMGGKYPESIAVVLWGTDNIKTYGESLAQVSGAFWAWVVKWVCRRRRSVVHFGRGRLVSWVGCILARTAKL